MESRKSVTSSKNINKSHVKTRSIAKTKPKSNPNTKPKVKPSTQSITIAVRTATKLILFTARLTVKLLTIPAIGLLILLYLINNRLGNLGDYKNNDDNESIEVIDINNKFNAVNDNRFGVIKAEDGTLLNKLPLEVIYNIINNFRSRELPNLMKVSSKHYILVNGQIKRSENKIREILQKYTKWPQNIVDAYVPHFVRELQDYNDKDVAMYFDNIKTIQEFTNDPKLYYPSVVISFLKITDKNLSLRDLDKYLSRYTTRDRLLIYELYNSFYR